MKKIFKSILFSTITLAVGYGALAFPFHLFNTLTRSEMRIVFVAEIIIYFAIFSAVMLAKEKNMQRKSMSKHCISNRTQSFLDMQDQICEIDNCNIETEIYTQVA